jgi:alpha-tubulin suppressor-like RCC1 family protein
MTRQQLEHAIRAACDVSGDSELLIFGSQAILGEYPEAPAPLRASIEVDVQPLNRPEAVDAIDGALGELSSFHQAFGFYVHGVSSSPHYFRLGGRGEQSRYRTRWGRAGAWATVWKPTTSPQASWPPTARRIATSSEPFFWRVLSTRTPFEIGYGNCPWPRTFGRSLGSGSRGRRGNSVGRRYIVRTEPSYFELLRQVPAEDRWEDWVVMPLDRAGARPVLDDPLLPEWKRSDRPPPDSRPRSPTPGDMTASGPFSRTVSLARGGGRSVAWGPLIPIEGRSMSRPFTNSREGGGTMPGRRAAVRRFPAAVLALLLLAPLSGKAGQAGAQETVLVERPWTQLAMGVDHVCGLKADGGAYCWGANSNGQLGNGRQGQVSATPTAVVGNLRFQHLSATTAATCGVTMEGLAYCWGGNPNGTLGSADAPRTSAEPLQVELPGNEEAVAVAAGVAMSCALTQSGAAWCWGRSGRALGLPDPRRIHGPVRIGGNHRFSRIVTMTNSACALTEEGAAWCWGSSGFGALGSRETGGSPIPVPVLGDLRYRDLRSYSDTVCGVTDDGRLVCWGEMGIGLPRGTMDGSRRGVPVYIWPDLRFQMASIGRNYGCGVLESGEASCWGWNGGRQLGDGTTTNRDTPVRVAGGIPFTAVEASPMTHTCGIAGDGSAWCWGARHLGIEPGSASSTVPVRVAEP